MRQRHARPLLVAAALVTGACHGAGTPRTTASAPPLLLSSEQVPAQFAWQQTITGTFRGNEHRAQAVVQNRAGKLLVLFLTAFGTRALSVELEGREVSVTRYVDEELPFDPQAIIVDVQRAFLLGMAAALPDGRHERTEGNTRYTDDWRGGRLMRRSLCEDQVTIDYGAGLRPFLPSGTVTLNNHLLGYRLRIDTHSSKRLDFEEPARPPSGAGSPLPTPRAIK